MMLDHVVNRGAGRRTGEGIAPECRAVNANSGRHAFPAKNRSHRHTTGNAFGKTHHVRREIKVLAGKELAGAAEPRLDLINDQQCTPFAAKTSCRLKVFLLRGTHTSLALDHFQDHGTSAVIARGFQFLNIV